MFIFFAIIKETEFDKTICTKFKDKNITDNDYIKYLNYAKLFSKKRN